MMLYPPFFLFSILFPWAYVSSFIIQDHPVSKSDIFQNCNRVKGIVYYFGSKFNVFLCRQILNQIIELEHKAHICSAVCS